MVKRQHLIKALFISGVLCLAGMIIGFQSPLVEIQTIRIEQQTLLTRIIMETSGELQISGSYYPEQSPQTLSLNIRGVQTSSLPQDFGKTSGIIDNIRLRAFEGERILLLIDVKEPVPYRLVRKNGQTIIELYPIQRTSDRYVTNSESSISTGGNPHTLRDIDTRVSQDRIDIQARLSGEVVPQIFVLGEPLRMVVDLYNTVHQGRFLNSPINRMGVRNVRSAQFERGNPGTISRIVFDLDGPKRFDMDSAPTSLTFSFFEDSPAAAVPQENNLEIPIEDTVGDTSTEKIIPDTISVGAAEEKAATADPQVEKKIERTVIPPENLGEQQVTPPINSSQTLGQTDQEYTGDLIDYRVRDMDIRDAILTITSIANLNVIFNPEVSGASVTVDLVAIPWDQALDLVLKEHKLGRSIEGNVLRIAPIDVLTLENEEQRRLSESREMAGPKVHRTFQLSYARAKDIETLLTNKISDRGEIIVDERTNTLIISDVSERIGLIEDLVRVFDKATPQVSIEARIVEATSNFVRNLGIQWGWRTAADPFYGNQTSLQFPNKVLVDGALIPQGIATRGIAGPLGGYAINLPAPSFSSALSLSFANVLDSLRIDMAISALETTGEGQIISSPSITTQNNKEAEIVQGRQIPLQTTANFTVTTRYQNAALELRATPQISHDGTITLTIDIQNNAPDFANLVNGIPPIITQSAITTVTIPDGGTTVIGGIYRTEEATSRERVPFLSRIPIIGNLFKSTARNKQKRELLIFITPRIIK
ncbi:type IV pilus secretin PilQ [Acidobacteriota bacterium]